MKEFVADFNFENGNLILYSHLWKIPENMYVDRQDIITVTICEGIESVGDYAFWNCPNLMWVKISASVNSIGENAFRDCSSLERFEVDPDNAVFCSIDGVLFRKEPLQLIQYPLGRKESTYSVPDGVVEIGDVAFSRSVILTNIILPDSLKVIHDWAFFVCTGLTDIKIPSSVEYIGEYVFSDCSSLTDIDFPDGMQTLPGGILSDCASLQYINIPDNVKYIKHNSFNNCTSLQRIRIHAGVEMLDPVNFESCSQLAAIDVDADNPLFCDIDGVLYTKDRKILLRVPPAYPNERFVIPECVQEIEDYAFNSCSNIADIVIPDSVIRIGYEAFGDCSSLKEIRMPKSVEEIGISYKIDFCESDEDEFDFPFLVSVFCGCTSLARIDVDEGNDRFCSKDGVLFSKDMSEILLFPANHNCHSYTIPDGVQIIGGGAFDHCEQLESVSIPSTVTEIGNLAFSGTELPEIVIPSSVKHISETAFFQCETKIIR